MRDLYRTILFFTLSALIVACEGNEKRKDDKQNLSFEKQTIDSSITKAGDNPDFVLLHQKNASIKVPKLKGKVSKITQTNHWYKKERDGNIVLVEKKLNKTLFEFNPKGQITVFDIYRDDNELFFVNHYYYDTEGSLIAARESNETRFMVMSIPYYNKENIIAKKVLINGNNIDIGVENTIIDFTLNNLTEVKYWNQAQSKTKDIKTLDASGRVLKLEYFEKPIKVAFGNAAENVTTYEYDESGNCIKESQYQPWGLTENYEERLYAVIDNTYDENGNLITSIENDKNGKIKQSFEVSYKFDKTGNWIEKLTLRNGINYSLLKREIVYFKK